MPRLFDGVNDWVKLSLGQCNVTFGTMAAMVRRNADGVLHSLWNTVDSTGQTRLSLALSAGNEIRWGSDPPGGSALSPTIRVVAADGWSLVVVGKATGTATPRFHRYKFSTGVWTHENASGTVGNANAVPGGNLELGANSNGASTFLNGDMEVVGCWGRVLSDQEVENLAFGLPGWLSAAPNGLWLLDQSLTTQKIIDWTVGGANESVLTGTAVGTVNAPFSRFARISVQNSGFVQSLPTAFPAKVVSNPRSRVRAKGRHLWLRFGTIAWDSYTRLPGEVTSGLGRAESSVGESQHVWAERASDGAAVAPYWEVRSGAATLRRALTACHFLTWLPAGLADGRVLVTLVLGSKLTSPGVGIYFRGSADDEGLLFTAVSTTAWQWGRLIVGAYTSIQQVASPVTLVAGTRYRLEIRFRGSQVSAYLNGTQIGNNEWINAYQTERRHGLYCYQDTGHSFDNVQMFRN